MPRTAKVETPLEYFPSLSAHADKSHKELLPPPDPSEVHRRALVPLATVCLDELLRDALEAQSEAETLDVCPGSPSERYASHRYMSLLVSGHSNIIKIGMDKDKQPD